MFELLSYSFMQRAFVVGICMAIVAPMVGIFLVMRRYSMMADTMSHVSLLGIVVGLIVHISPPLSAFVISVIAALGIERLRAMFRSFGDAALSLMLSGSLALAVLIISLQGGNLATINAYLFGSITTVTNIDVILISLLSFVVIALVLFFYRPLMLMSFDEDLARADGLPVQKLQIVFLVLIAAVVSITISTVGALLIGALMIIPVMTAMRGAHSFKEVIIMAILYSLLSVLSGLFLSYAIDVPTGASIVLIALALFVGRTLEPVG